MNYSTIERFIISYDNTPKGQVVSKKMYNAEKRISKFCQSYNTSLARRKEKRVRHETQRIPAYLNVQDDLLENIHFANYMCLKDITHLPQYHTDQTLVISRKPKAEAVWEEEDSNSSCNEIPEKTEERLYIRMPRCHLKCQAYEDLQRKYLELTEAHHEYMELMYSYEQSEPLSDDDSIGSYESRYL
jgi:hypothetical protein